MGATVKYELVENQPNSRIVLIPNFWAVFKFLDQNRSA
jgi:hypothetical protein